MFQQSHSFGNCQCQNVQGGKMLHLSGHAVFTGNNSIDFTLCTVILFEYKYTFFTLKSALEWENGSTGDKCLWLTGRLGTLFAPCQAWQESYIFNLKAIKAFWIDGRF